MNIDLYAMDEEGNSRAEEERRSRRRRQKEEKGEPVTDEDLDYDQDEVDDFNTPKDANRVYATIRKMKKRFVLRLVATLVLFGLLTYLTISLDNINLPLLTFMLPEENMRAFIGVNLAVLVLAVVLNISTVFWRAQGPLHAEAQRRRAGGCSGGGGGAPGHLSDRLSRCGQQRQCRLLLCGGGAGAGL